ncbi:MAG: NAD-binding protein [Actinomycetota bacterium]|nr:NAD-binding protein [Actinomycetota bacterium]
MIDPAVLQPGRRRLVVCGDTPLSYRLAAELASDPDHDVTVILRAADANYAPRIIELAGVRVVWAAELNVAAYLTAGVAEAEALALTDQDDVANIHAALRAQEVNPGLRLVIRFFNMSLGYRIQELFPGSVVLSDSATAAPAFVAAALGEVAPGSVRLPGRPRQTLFVTRRGDVPASRVVCVLAVTIGPNAPVLLSPGESGEDPDLDLVLARADSGAESAGLRPRLSRRGGARLRPSRWAVAGLRGSLRDRAGLRPSRRGRMRARLRRWLSPLRPLLTRKLVIAALLLVLLLAIGTAGFALLTGESWLNSIYLTLLDAAGAAQPDLRLSAAAKAVQAAITIVGIAIIPVVTAAVVDTLVSARLGSSLGPPRRISGHVVLVGLGNVGARVLSQLHDLGVAVVAVDADPQARGIPRARRLGVPVVIGDASREEVLRETHLSGSRALVAVTSNDVTNLEAALHGRAMRAELRVVLRLFDDDLARRVEQTFGVNVSRSVSFLSAPTFAAAMLQRQVLATVPVGRRVLLVAEIAIPPGCALVGQPVASAAVAGTSEVIALQPHASEVLRMPAPPLHRLVIGDRLVVVATRAGLAELSARASKQR